MTSYDDRQLAALLKPCLGCRGWFYFVNHAADRCAACR